MHLSMGSIPPVFETEDIFGQPIRLADFAGRPLLLSFFRNAACAICNLRVHQMIERFPVYQQAELAILAVFESPRENMLHYVGKQDTPFPMVADPQAQLYARYGVETSEEKISQSLSMPQTQLVVQEAAVHGFHLIQEPGSNFHRLPADFLIGPDQIIYQAHYAQHVTDHLPFEEVERFLGEHVSS